MVTSAIDPTDSLTLASDGVRGANVQDTAVLMRHRHAGARYIVAFMAPQPEDVHTIVAIRADNKSLTRHLAAEQYPVMAHMSTIIPILTCLS